MIVVSNITRAEAGEYLKVRVRNLETNERYWIGFKKIEEKYSDLLFMPI